MVGLLLSLRALAVTGVPVRSAPDLAIDAALDLLALKDGDRFCDLGCGHGNVLERARQRANVDATGFELNPSIALLAGLRSLRDGKVHVRCRDSRRADLSNYTALYAFLMPRPMVDLAPLFEKLQPGTRIVSIDFAIPDWKPLETREVGSLRHPVRLYVVGQHHHSSEQPS